MIVLFLIIELFEEIICFGDILVVGDIILINFGFYEIELFSFVGCDSMV